MRIPRPLRIVLWIAGVFFLSTLINPGLEQSFYFIRCLLSIVMVLVAAICWLSWVNQSKV